MSTLWQIDVPVLLAAMAAGISCTLVGNTLVLTRKAMMSDALSHAVLPGLVGGYLLAGELNIVPMLSGALAAGAVSALLTEMLHREGRVEYGASLGVVFTVMFAIGVLMIEQTTQGRIHLDTDAVLFGQLEFMFWPALRDASGLLDSAVWAEAPRQTVTLLGLAVTTLILVVLLHKDIRLVAFDPLCARIQGYAVGLINLLFVLYVAVVAVFTLEAVGVILVIGLMLLPPAIARLLTRRYNQQIFLSLAVSVLMSFAGYGAAIGLPHLFDKTQTLNAGGMIVTVGGVTLFLVSVIKSGHKRTGVHKI